MTKQRFFLPTNSENLEIFLSSGLVISTSGVDLGFNLDVMSEYPQNYIPFFPDAHLTRGIEKSTEDDSNLVPCLIELDFTQILSMSVFSLRENGTIDGQPIDITEAQNLEDCAGLLLPSPLPLQCIKTVIFTDIKTKNEHVKSLERDLGDIANQLFSVNAKLFKSSNKADVTDLLSQETAPIHESVLEIT